MEQTHKAIRVRIDLPRHVAGELCNGIISQAYRTRLLLLLFQGSGWGVHETELVELDPILYERGSAALLSALATLTHPRDLVDLTLAVSPFMAELMTGDSDVAVDYLMGAGRMDIILLDARIVKEEL